MNDIERCPGPGAVQRRDDLIWPAATKRLERNSFWERDSIVERPIAGQPKLVGANTIPLIGRNIQDEQLVCSLCPRVDTKINWFKRIVATGANEPIDFDEPDFPLAGI